MQSLVLGGIAAISLLVGGIGIMNIMLVYSDGDGRTLSPYSPEPAHRHRGPILIIEAGMLCGMGGIVGIIFGTIGSVVLDASSTIKRSIRAVGHHRSLRAERCAGRALRQLSRHQGIEAPARGSAAGGMRGEKL